MHSSQIAVEGRFSTVQSATGRQHVFKRRQTIATLSTVTASPPAADSVASDKSPTCGSQPALARGVSIKGSATDDARRPRGSLRHRIRSPTAAVAAPLLDSDTNGVTASASNWNRRSGRRVHNRLSTEGTTLTSLSQPPQQHRKLGRTPSSPSVLFSRVKERIREKVFETSAEWPHMAAVERERRQRAAQAFEQSLRSSLNMRNAPSARQGQGQGQRQGHMQVVRQSGVASADDNVATNVPPTVEKTERRRVRIKSDPSRRTVVSGSTDNKEDEERSRRSHKPHVDWKEGISPLQLTSSPCRVISALHDVQQPPTTSMLARLAFRRRSISEDTYLLETKMVAAAAASVDSSSSSCRFLGPTDYSGSESSTKHRRQGDGVICSNEDLKAIVTQHKLRRSPAVSPTATHQPTSLDSQSTTLHLSVSDDVIVHVTSPCSAGVTDGGRTAFDQEAGFASELSDSTGDDRLASDSPVRIPPAAVVNLVDETQCVPDTLHDCCATIVSLPADDVDDGVKKKRCTVREVVYDEYGQTWDVYGADFDPEILGQAIQAYLEKIMNKELQRVGQQSARDSGGSGMASDSEVQGSRDSHLCESSGGRQGQRHIDRAVGFIMRYLCSSMWRQPNQVTKR